MEKSIIKSAGSAIVKNKEEVKILLAKYGIPYGSGKASDLILGVFKAIKSGNKELSADIAGLIAINKGRTPQERAKLKATITEKVTLLKNKIRLIGEKIAALRGSKETTSGNTVISASAEVGKTSDNADGSTDSIEENSALLSSTIEAGDPELLSKDAMETVFISAALVVSALVLVAIIVLVFYYDRIVKLVK